MAFHFLGVQLTNRPIFSMSYYTLLDQKWRQKMFKTQVEPRAVRRWFQWKVWNILWCHNMVYKSVDHGKMWSMWFIPYQWKFLVNQIDKQGQLTRAWQLIPSQFFPPEAVKCLRNLTFYECLDFFLKKGSIVFQLSRNLPFVALPVTSYHDLYSRWPQLSTN